MPGTEMQGLLSVNSAATYLSIGRSKTYELLLKGSLRSVTIGRRRLVPVAELERFVQRLMEESDGADGLGE